MASPRQADNPVSRTLSQAPHKRSAVLPQNDAPPVLPALSDDEAAAERLAVEMATAWRQGERPLVEDMLARHPEVEASPELTARLIYEEFCLRQEIDQQVATVEVLGRFPHLGNELRVMLECHRLLEGSDAAPSFPEPGEALGGFVLLAELGRGARGRVFLATQPALADRPVVLKFAPASDHEHLSLARLQHTHIVPLYSQEDFPSRRLRALCMPYLGGLTLAELLDSLGHLPAARRTGQSVREALERSEAASVLPLPQSGAARAVLAPLSYVQAVCRIGACLADALHYAHERGLLHLDVKPSNVLLAADGQPLLLDFHLAQEPLVAGQAAPGWLGGTRGYMPPEQVAALAAVPQGKPVPQAIDARADVYALGALVYEMLAGQVPEGDTPVRLERCNPEVSVGLADVIHRCLERDATRRYPGAGALAVDLRRHLDNLPLRGVRNRSLAERWSKWRRRRPYAVLLGMLWTALIAGLFAAWAFGTAHYEKRRHEAERSLDQARALLHAGRPEDAVQTLTRGQELAHGLPGQSDLRQGLDDHLRLARRAVAAQKVHFQAEILRLLSELEVRDPRKLHLIAAGCRAAWKARDLLAASPETVLEVGERDIRFDLIDLAVLWADLGVKLAREADRPAARQEALRLLDEVESITGSSPVLDTERALHAAALGLHDRADAARRRAAAAPPSSPEEHCALARRLLQEGDIAGATGHVEAARRMQPDGFLPNWYRAACALRGRRYQEAVEAYCVCIGRAPWLAECHWKRATAYAALGRHADALADLDLALQVRPDLGLAALDRGLLHLSQKRTEAAAADLEHALKNGADPAAAHYHLAVLALDRGDRAAAAEHVREALRQRPGHEEARRLLERIKDER